MKTIYWKRLIDPVKHLSWSFLQKRLTVYSRKQFSPKVPPHMFERVLNNTNFYYDESYSPQLLSTSSKSIDLMQNTSPLFNIPLTHTIKLQRMKI